jgi:biotin carboxyl carrier protein
MITVKVNNKEYLVDTKNETLNGKPFNADVQTLSPGRFHVIHNHRSFTVEILEHDRAEKRLHLRINNNTYFAEIKDKYDELLHALGMDSAGQAKVNEMKAPMPGLVLDVMVSEGQEIKAGDSVLILEAMKMENVLKSPSDATVKKIEVKKSDKVEKNQILIRFA